MVEGSRAKMPGRCARVALVGETLDQAREVMVFGESGILACAPPDRLVAMSDLHSSYQRRRDRVGSFHWVKET